MRYSTPRSVRATALFLLAPLIARSADAEAPAAETVFPADTVAFLSIPNPAKLSENFRKTQLGQLVDDASMQDFARHLRDEAVNQVGDVERRLAVTVDDVFDAAGGELAIGVVHRSGAPAALLMTLDVTGKQAEADAMLAKVEQDFAARGGSRSVSERAGVTLVRYDVPATEAKPGKPARDAQTVVYFQRGDLLVAVDSADEVDRVFAAAADGAPSPLAGADAYQRVMGRTRAEAGGEPIDLSWCVDPFRFDAARATMRMPEFLANRKDLMTILGENGFKAIEAVGGVVGLAVDSNRDLVHRTVFYAPGDPSAGATPGERFRGAMRIMDAPNRPDLGVEKWAPRGAATYNTFSLNIQGVFDHLAPLFDAVAGYEDAFKRTLESFEKDPYGPKISIRDAIIKHLGGRITSVTDYNLPVTPDCERYLFVVEVRDEAALRGPLDKLMKADGAERRELNGVPYWEVIPEEEEPVAGGLEFDDPLFDDPLLDEGIDGGPAGAGAEADARHSAVCLHSGQLVITSDVGFLQQVLFGPEPNEALAGCEDFQFAAAQLDKLAPWARAGWSFVRNDEAIRPTYELIRAGRMPESQTFFGRLLNQALTTDEDEQKGIVRRQRLDGSTMPTFELARRYFGPSVRALRTDDDGWLLVGVLLNKENQ